MPLLAVNHHYYRDSGTGRGIYPTTPSALQNEVRKIRSAGWRIGNEADILASLAGDLAADDKVVILTFDDGLREQMAAVQQLEGLGASAICYVPTAPIVERCVLDVHKLQMIRARVNDVQVASELDRSFCFSKKEFDDQLLSIQYRYDDELGRRVKYFLNFMLEEDARLDWTARYFESLFGDEREVAAWLYMSRDDLRELSAKRMLGSHAHSHQPLATLASQRIAHELEYSYTLLAEMVGSPPAGVSYPFGGKSAVGAEVFNQASLGGYKYGFTMERGISYVATAAAAMSLRRIDVNDLDDWLNTTNRE